MDPIASHLRLLVECFILMFVGFVAFSAKISTQKMLAAKSGGKSESRAGAASEGS